MICKDDLKKLINSKLPSWGAFEYFLENLDSENHSRPRRYSPPIFSAKTKKMPSFIYYDIVMTEKKMKGFKSRLLPL